MGCDTEKDRGHAYPAGVRALVQRVRYARVRVPRPPGSEDEEADPEVIARIGPGLCALVGVTHTDTPAVASRLAEKVWHLRIVDDEAGVMNRSVADTTRSVLVVSQFTLYGDISRGRRPSWVAAAPSSLATSLVEEFATALRSQGAQVATGRFGAHMWVELENDGPVTLMVEV